ncbi:putative reverse transcriptase domain-containing protein [Tanacetum coccineum]
MAPKRATRSNTAPETTNTTSVTNAQLQAMINKGVTVALAARDADKNMNSDDSHNSRTVENQVKFATCTLHSVDLTWWNTHVKIVGHDAAYGRMFPEESDKIEKYVGGLFDMIHESVVASKPKTMQEVVEIATELMDKKIRTFVERSSEKKPYGGSEPICAKCNYHHDGPCALKCQKCNRVGHLARDCRSTANANTVNNQRGTRTAKVYAIGHAGTNPDSNVVTGMFLLNNRYASVLFDTGANRSFVSTTFSSQIDITPTALDHF